MIDKRYQVIKDRLSNLQRNEIERIIINADLLCLDEFNYDEQNKKYCPLAIGMNLHNTVDNPTDQKIKREISKRFTPVNVIAGVDGSFYRNNRKDDILKVCKEILSNELYSS